MEGSSKKWQEFSKRDRIAAENFAKAASETNTKRIIYLSGLIDMKHNDLSEHMRSRKEVGLSLPSYYTSCKNMYMYLL